MTWHRLANSYQSYPSAHSESAQTGYPNSRSHIQAIQTVGVSANRYHTIQHAMQGRSRTSYDVPAVRRSVDRPVMSNNKGEPSKLAGCKMKSGKNVRLECVGWWHSALRCTASLRRQQSFEQCSSVECKPCRGMPFSHLGTWAPHNNTHKFNRMPIISFTPNHT